MSTMRVLLLPEACLVDVVISSLVQHVDQVEETCTFSGLPRPPRRSNRGPFSGGARPSRCRTSVAKAHAERPHLRGQRPATGTYPRRAIGRLRARVADGDSITLRDRLIRAEPNRDSAGSRSRSREPTPDAWRTDVPHSGIMRVIEDHPPFGLGISAGYAGDRGAERHGPGASRSPP